MINNDTKVFFEELIEQSPELSKSEKELKKLFDEFKKKFGQVVPTSMLPDGISDIQLSEAIKRCLDEGENKIFEFLGVTIRDDVLY